MRMALGPYISAAALVLCTLLVLLWSRSYERCEIIARTNGSAETTTLGSNKGTIYFISGPAFWSGPREWTYHSSKVNDRGGAEYQFKWTQNQKKLKAPYRLVIPLVAVVGLAPWIGKFTLIDAALIAAPHLVAFVEAKLRDA